MLMKRLAAVAAAIVWPFERALSSAARMLLRAGEGFEGVEWALVRLGKTLIAPLQVLWRLLRAATAAVVPQSLRHAVGTPVRAATRLGRKSGEALVRVAEALNLDGAVLRIVKWLRPLWYPFAALGGFLQAWLATRNYRQLVWGLPVVLVLLPLTGIAAWTALWGRGSIAAQYRLAVKEAREAKDYERVRLFERKLAQLGVSTQLVEYQTASALAQDGKYGEAYERMQRLAPAGRPGYPHAHFWIVQHLMNGTVEASDAERNRLTKIHLDHLQAIGAKGADVDLLRAIWLSQNQRHQEAAKLLEPFASRILPAAVMRMEIHIAQKKIEEARGDARWVRSHMGDRMRRGEMLSPRDFHSWAIAEELLGNLPKAHALVEQWLKAEPESKDARRILAELSRRLFDQALTAPDPDADQLARLFFQSVESTEDPLQRQQQVAALYQLRGQFPVIQEVLTQILDSPQTPALVLEAVGTAAAMAGDLGMAKDYLRRSTTKDPRHSVARNNYAWVVLQEPKGDLEDALAAVNKALEIRPDEFRFRETRGQILARLGRWQEAIAELEYAANGMPESSDIHRSLAKAYDALGEKQLAQVHREHAE
jgi:tetratricopeptide (TPR) repeat protein